MCRGIYFDATTRGCHAAATRLPRALGSWLTRVPRERHAAVTSSPARLPGEHQRSTGERRNCFPELSSVRAGKHIRQDDGRFTRTDQHIVEAALAFSDPPARGSICSSVAMTLLWPTGPRLKLPGDEARYAATLESLFVCPTVNGASSETRTV